jgi:hypothetical protein
VIYFRYRLIEFRDPKIVHPAANVFLDLLHAEFHRNAPTSTSQLSDPAFEFLKSRIRPADFGSLECKPQEFRFIGRSNPAFLLVDGQLEPALQEPTDALGYPFTGPETFHENEEVIGVPDET